MSDEIKGMVLGMIGVAIFSITLPATRIAVLGGLDAVFVGLGRAVVAAMAAAAILAVRCQPLPDRRHWGRLVVVALGVVLGFPLFSAIAMQTVPAAHGGVVMGVLPLATTVAAALLCRERPSAAFWALALLGGAVVIAFAVLKGTGGLVAGDWWLLLAVAAAGVGYAVGGELSRTLCGWQVICWALIVALPFTLPVVAWHMDSVNWGAPTRVWAAFLYVALFSQLIAFFAWNRGLALGGVARVSQVQLLQVFMTLAASAWLLGEDIDGVTLVFAVGVVGVVAVGRRMPVARRSP